MARILAISSLVARGHIGLSIITPLLQAFGHDVTALPTVILSNHPGHPRVAGERIAPAMLQAMLDTLDGNGWLDEVDAVLTGYLPTADHVSFASRTVDRLRASGNHKLFLCDPVLGDDPKGLYLDAAAAEAIRSELLPRADIATPNRFELEWLTGRSVNDRQSACLAARHLGPRCVVATSIPAAHESLDTIAVSEDGAFAVRVPMRTGVPNGTGDGLAALFLSATIEQEDVTIRLDRSVGAMQALIEASLGRRELDLVGARARWTRPNSLIVESIP